MGMSVSLVLVTSDVTAENHKEAAVWKAAGQAVKWFSFQTLIEGNWLTSGKGSNAQIENGDAE